MTTQIFDAEAMARQIVQALATLDERRPQSAIELTETIACAGAAVQLAIDRGWLLIEGSHSVYLTNEGRRFAKG